MPAMRSKVEMIKDVKTGKKPDLKIVLAVGDVALLVEPCELKEQPTLAAEAISLMYRELPKTISGPALVA